MTGDDLPDAAQVVRYVRPSHIREDGDVDGRAFRLREDEGGLSVNWLDYFAGLSKAEQLNEVRRFSRLTLSRNGRFAELNVGDVKQAVRAELPELPMLRFVHDPRLLTAHMKPTRLIAWLSGCQVRQTRGWRRRSAI